MSSGILPVIIDINFNVKILLGKEYNGWSGFSGSSEKNETSIQTGLREFHEETANVFKNYINEEYINENIINKLSSTTPTGKTFDMYIVNFSKLPIEIINKIDYLFVVNRKKTINKYEKEKTKIEWFTIDDVKKLNLRYCFHKDYKMIYKSINEWFKNINNNLKIFDGYK